MSKYEHITSEFTVHVIHSKRRNLTDFQRQFKNQL